jgi:hypothetical protein
MSRVQAQKRATRTMARRSRHALDSALEAMKAVHSRLLGAGEEAPLLPQGIQILGDSVGRITFVSPSDPAAALPGLQTPEFESLVRAVARLEVAGGKRPGGRCSCTARAWRGCGRQRSRRRLRALRWQTCTLGAWRTGWARGRAWRSGPGRRAHQLPGAR